MPSKLIEMEDGVVVEVEVPQDQVDKIAGTSDAVEQVDTALDTVHPILLKACRPVISVWDELNREMCIDKVEVELQLGFSADGSVFLAKAKGNANLKIKLSVSPKAGEI